MKANVTKEVGKKPITNTSKYRLTIGMITKNEQKRLRRCLDTVKKLMDKVKCELIITDTGSTDNTVAIAKEYATTVNYFEWCNDYGAARNVALDMAQGEWFMYLDSDEWLDDKLIDSLASILNSEERLNYRCMELNIHSYKDLDFITYIDMLAARIVLKSDGQRFNRKVHETLKAFYPSFVTKGYLEHDGYAYEFPEQAQQKSEKYNKMIEESLVDDPTNYSLIVSYLSSVKKEKKERVLGLAYNILDTLTMRYKLHIYSDHMEYYNSRSLYESALKYGKELLSLVEPNDVLGADFCYNYAVACYYCHCFDDFDFYYDKYFKEVQWYLNGEFLDKTVTTSLFKLNDEYEMLGYLVNKMKFVSDATADLTRFSSFDLQRLANAENIVTAMLALYEQKKDINIIKTLLTSIDKITSNEKKAKAVKMLCSDLVKYTGNTEFVELLKNNFIHNIYAQLFCDVYNLKHNIVDNLFFTQIDKEQVLLEKTVSLYILVALLADLSLLNIVNYVEKDELDYCFACLGGFDGFAALIYKKHKQLRRDSLQMLSACIALEQEAFSRTSKIINLQNHNELAYAAVEDLKQYVLGYYSNDVIENEREMLSAPHAFAAMLLSADDKGPEYIKALRAAVNDYPEMSEIAKSLIEMLEQEVKEQSVAQNEFALLSIKIKQSVNEMMQEGQYAQAISVINQLMALTPNDTELSALLAQCNALSSGEMLNF